MSQGRVDVASTGESMMPPMAMELKVDTDAEEVGFDAGRLERIDRHFARYVDEGQLPGWLIVVTRRGKVAHLSSCGYADVEARRPVEIDTLWRIFSMSKPVTSVAAMMLFEEGAFDLTDPIARWLPEFTQPQVYVKGSALNPLTAAATEPIRLWHLLTHTSGLTYGFHHAHPVDAMYRAAGFEWGTPPGLDLAGCVEQWAHLPLVFQPGSEWNYSVSSDVLGRLVEVVSGQPLDEFFRQRIFAPLGMDDTSFGTEGDDLAALYVARPGTRKAVSGRRVRRCRPRAAGLPVGRRRLGVLGRRLPPVHPIPFAPRRVGGSEVAQPTHRRADDEQPPSR